jgi:DNA-directed RNA polymerase subunit E'/Rpb7
VKEPELIGEIPSRRDDGYEIRILMFRTFREESDQIDGRHYVANGRPSFVTHEGEHVFRVGDHIETMSGARLHTNDPRIAEVPDLPK